MFKTLLAEHLLFELSDRSTTTCFIICLKHGDDFDHDNIKYQKNLKRTMCIVVWK